MNRDLQKILADLKNGTAPSLLLLFGDDFQVQEACKDILDFLVPENRRGFNLERFDGRAAAWDQIEASLNTPPFLPGIKVVWVENAPYFFSRDQRGELGEKILQLWSEGKKDEAGRLLMDLLVTEGWSREQWEEVQSKSAWAAIAELLGAEEREPVEEIIAHCRSRGLELGDHRGEVNGLTKLLDERLPPWDFLLLTASQVDRRTRLYKRFEEIGAVLPLGLERDRSGRVSRESLAEFIHQQLRRAGKTAEPQALEMILLRAGEGLRGLKEEIEKLLLYVGEQPVIRSQDVEAICTDRGEGWVFDLTRSIGDRDAAAALLHLARLFVCGEHPLKLLGTIASDVRRLLAARELIDAELRGRWKRGMTYLQFQQSVCREGTAPLTRNAYADYMCMQRAERFTLRELRRHLAQIYDTDLRLKTSGNQPRLVMEKLILDMCLGFSNDKRPVENRART